jgi:hypothetical protein
MNMNRDIEAKRLGSIRQLFPETGRDHWYDLAHKELGPIKPMESLLWEIEEDIVIDPLCNHVRGVPRSLTGNQGWQLAETCRLPLSGRDNDRIARLELGEIMLDPDEIGLPAMRSMDAPQANSSLILKSIKDTEIDLIPSWLRFVKIEELDKVTRQSLLSANFEWRYATADDAASPSFQIADIIRQLIHYLQDDSEKSITPGRYRIYLGLSDRYLEEIAKIRALKLVILNLWKVLRLNSSSVPSIYCHIETSAPDSNLSLIQATVKSMAATISGVDFIYFDAVPGTESAEYMRLRRNIHYILRHESHLHHRLDPLAGSHLMEELTEKIAFKAWEKIRGKG